MPSIHFRTTVDAPPDHVYDALATQDGLAGNWTDQLEVPEETGGVAGFGFGPDWAKTLELRIDALEPGRLVQWTPIGGFPGWIGTSITWRLEPADDGGTVVHFTHGGWPEPAADGEMAMCGYTWAMIINRLAEQVARGERAPYFKAGEPLPPLAAGVAPVAQRAEDLARAADERRHEPHLLGAPRRFVLVPQHDA